LWILLIFALMTESMPQPRDFRGESATATMDLFNSVAVTNRGVYIPSVEFAKPFFAETWQNWFLVIVLLVGSIFAIRRLGTWATAKQETTGIRPTLWYINVAIFIVPAGVLMALMGAHLDLPFLKGFNFTGGTHLRNSLIALWLALSLYTGAFIAEIVRGGILAISKGQTEAAYALGIRPNITMNLVILPQAMRVIIPPLISQYLNLTKNSSLAIAVGYMDVRSTLGGITINQTGRELEGMLLLGLFYLLASLIISGAMNIYNNSVKLKER
jgi:general L-amino acid transport system permease protein